MGVVSHLATNACVMVKYLCFVPPLPHAEAIIDGSVVDKLVVLGQPFACAIEESGMGEIEGNVADEGVVAGDGIGVVIMIPHPPNLKRCCWWARRWFPRYSQSGCRWCHTPA